MYPIARNTAELLNDMDNDIETKLDKDYKILNLGNMNITKLPQWFGNILDKTGFRIEKLNLSHNELIKLPFSIGNLYKLETLYVSYNKLSTIPKTISKLEFLNTLYLDNNKFTSFPTSLFNIKSLKVLNLRHNQITDIHPNIGFGLQKLEFLELSDNQLSSLPDSFGNLQSLKTLYLKNNLFTETPSILSQMPNLTKIAVLNPSLPSQSVVLGLPNNELYLSHSKPKLLLKNSFSNNHPLFAQAEFIRNLDDYSLDFLREYTNHYYQPEKRKKQIDKIIENIFKQIPATTQEFKVYRGVTKFPFEKERNFISTSTRQEVAHNFVNQDNNGCCILVITIKVGSKVLPLKEISQYPDEDELLLHGNGVYLIKQERLTNTGSISLEPKTKVKRSVPKSMSGSQTLSSTKNYKMKKYYIDYFYSGPMSSLESLKIITMNIGARIQMNIEEGSEKEFVQLCKAIYTDTLGLSSIQNQTHTLSQCSLNAAQWLASQNVGLIGLQETVIEYLPLFMTAFQPNYQCLGHDSACIIYDELQLGKPIMLSTKGLFVGGDNRPMVILWFPEPKLLAVNLHAEHNINLKMEITKAFNSVMSQQSIISQMGIKNEEDVERIIVMGDFNDGQGTLQSLHLFGLTLKQHSHLPIYSCCADSNYKYQGDYIFDSDFNLLGNYGTPLTGFHPYEKKSGKFKQVNDNLPMSDHDPVVFYPGL